MIDKTDALLLHYAFDFHIDINRMLSDDFAELCNMPHHQLAKDELMARLLNLYDNKMIKFNLFDEMKNIKTTLASWESISQLRYWLTPQGAEIWESLYCPDWDKYFSSSEEVVSESQKLVIIKSQNYVSVFEKCGAPQKITKLINWYPFYWKKLNSGYIFFDLLPIEEEEALDLELINLKQVKWHLNWEEI